MREFRCKMKKTAKKTRNLLRNFEAEILRTNKEQQAQLNHKVPYKKNVYMNNY